MFSEKFDLKSVKHWILTKFTFKVDSSVLISTINFAPRNSIICSKVRPPNTHNDEKVKRWRWLPCHKAHPFAADHFTSPPCDYKPKLWRCLEDLLIQVHVNMFDSLGLKILANGETLDQLICLDLFSEDYWSCPLINRPHVSQASILKMARALPPAAICCCFNQWRNSSVNWMAGITRDI